MRLGLLFLSVFSSSTVLAEEDLPRFSERRPLFAATPPSNARCAYLQSHTPTGGNASQKLFYACVSYQ